jgi:tetratricopeptide (TPR) repeat protein
MKSILLLAVFLFAGLITTAQSGKKPVKQNKKPSVQKELEELEKEMADMDPEERKMLEKMGIKGTLENMKKMNGKEMQEAWENADIAIPKRDAARIASISQKPLTHLSMADQLKTVHGKVVTVLKPAAKNKAEEIYNELKTQHNGGAMGNAAVGLWMMGKTEMAIYTMGKACMDDPANTDNISNYASMLSMNGGEHLALPFLHYLNATFPKNSTLLNNIGQAWFGLGEISKAEKYLDSAIRIYAYHPQANFTQAVIEESKGETTKAVESAKKSIKEKFSGEKENFLRRQKYQLRPRDLSWDFPLPQDPLGLHKFTWPEYPFTIKQQDKLKEEWQKFITDCEAENQKLELQETALRELKDKVSEKRNELMMRGNLAGMPFPLMALKAHTKLKYLFFETGGEPISEEKKWEAVKDAILHVDSIKDKHNEGVKKLREKYEPKFGEGKENPFEAACADFTKVSSAYLERANKILQYANDDYLNFLRRMLNNQIYYKQYTAWPEDFELEKVIAKRKWLMAISAQKVILDVIDGRIYCQDNEEDKPKSTKLAEFDDVACNYHSVLSLPVGTIKIDCSRITTELDIGFLKLGLKQNMDKLTFGDQFISATVEAGVEVGKETKLGPLTVGATGGARVGIEIDRTGITDVYIVGGVSAGVSTTVISDATKALEMSTSELGTSLPVKDISVEAGVEGRISIISGKGSMGGTGILKGIK